MNIKGLNIYRITYKISHIRDLDFTKVVLAYSEREAAAYMAKDEIIFKISLIDSDTNLVIPDQYLS